MRNKHCSTSTCARAAGRACPRMGREAHGQEALGAGWAAVSRWRMAGSAGVGADEWGDAPETCRRGTPPAGTGCMQPRLRSGCSRFPASPWLAPQSWGACLEVARKVLHQQAQDACGRDCAQVALQRGHGLRQLCSHRLFRQAKDLCDALCRQRLRLACAGSAPGAARRGEQAARPAARVKACRTLAEASWPASGLHHLHAEQLPGGEAGSGRLVLPAGQGEESSQGGR